MTVICTVGLVPHIKAKKIIGCKTNQKITSVISHISVVKTERESNLIAIGRIDSLCLRTTWNRGNRLGYCKYKWPVSWKMDFFFTSSQ